MVKDRKHITQLVEDSLRNAIREARNGNFDGNQVQFKRIVFSADHNLVVVEIGLEQQRDLPESFFEKDVKALLSHSYCSKIDVMDVGESTFIYCWISSNERNEKMKARSIFIQPYKTTLTTQ